MTGYDAHDQKIWEYWDSSNGDSWQGVSSLFPESGENGQFLADVFPGFLRWWQDENWKKSVKLILHCYLEANIGSGGAEGAIILEQTALELIAYILFVEVEQVGLNGRAAEKIKSLLTKFGISKDVPPESTQNLPSSEEPLSAFARALEVLKPRFPTPLVLENLRQVMERKNSKATQENQKWEDGPRALTGIRNDIAHAKKDLDFLDETETARARWDASDLGLWYLDVVLLNLFGYQGNYINRLNGNIKLVPRANIGNFAVNQHGTQQTTQIPNPATPNPSQTPKYPNSPGTLMIQNLDRQIERPN